MILTLIFWDRSSRPASISAFLPSILLLTFNGFLSSAANQIYPELEVRRDTNNNKIKKYTCESNGAHDKNVFHFVNLHTQFFSLASNWILNASCCELLLSFTFSPSGNSRYLSFSRNVQKISNFNKKRSNSGAPIMLCHKKKLPKLRRFRKAFNYTWYAIFPLRLRFCWWFLRYSFLVQVFHFIFYESLNVRAQVKEGFRLTRIIYLSPMTQFNGRKHFHWIFDYSGCSPFL